MNGGSRRPGLWLHAGFHKTGTSAIQRYAAWHTPSLRKRGVHYPQLWPLMYRPVSAHHFLAHAVAGKCRYFGPDEAAGLIEGWRRRAQSRGLSVLLSSEAFCRHSLGGATERDLQGQEAYLRRLVQILSGFEIRPVLVIRRQDEFVRSLYQEHVLAGLGRSGRIGFGEFLDQFATEKARFLPRLRLFRSVFGNLTVLVYEDLAASGLVSSFFRAIGIDGIRARDRRVVRPSLSVAETLVKQRLNGQIHTEEQNKRLLRWLRSRVVRCVIGAELGTATSLWPDEACRRRFLETFDQENRQLGQEFLGLSSSPFAVLGNSNAKEEVPSPARVERTLALAASRTKGKLRAIIGSEAVEGLNLGK